MELNLKKQDWELITSFVHQHIKRIYSARGHNITSRAERERIVRLQHLFDFADYKNKKLRTYDIEINEITEDDYLLITSAVLSVIRKRTSERKKTGASVRLTTVIKDTKALNIINNYFNNGSCVFKSPYENTLDVSARVLCQ